MVPATGQCEIWSGLARHGRGLEDESVRDLKQRGGWEWEQLTQVVAQVEVKEES